MTTNDTSSTSTGSHDGDPAPLIQLEDVGKHYGNVVAEHAGHLVFPNGQVDAFEGDNVAVVLSHVLELDQRGRVTVVAAGRGRASVVRGHACHLRWVWLRTHVLRTCLLYT